MGQLAPRHLPSCHQYNRIGKLRTYITPINFLSKPSNQKGWSICTFLELFWIFFLLHGTIHWHKNFYRWSQQRRWRNKKSCSQRCSFFYWIFILWTSNYQGRHLGGSSQSVANCKVWFTFLNTYLETNLYRKLKVFLGWSFSRK